MKARIWKILVTVVAVVVMIFLAIFLLPTENVADDDLDDKKQVSSSQSNTTDTSSDLGEQLTEDTNLSVESSPILTEESSSVKEQVSSEVKEETETPPAAESTEVVEQPESTTSTNTTGEYNDLLDNVPLSADLQHYVLNLCNEYGLDPAVVFAVMYCESGFNANISNGACTGLMQLHKSYFSGNLYDPYNNAKQGIQSLAELYNEHGDYNRALMCYNMGSGGASKYFNQGIYTSSYSRKVLEKANDYR